MWTSVWLGAALALLTAAPAGMWQRLAAGLEVRSDATEQVATEALRIDPTQLRLRVMLATDLGRPGARARDFVAAAGGLAAVNGGFFDPRMLPVGLRVTGGRVVAGARRDALGALAVLRGGRIAVVLGADVPRLTGIRELVQCGPRLVVGGRPNRLKPQVARRTAAGVDGGGRLVLLVTSAGAFEAGELAERLARPEAEGGYGLIEALNLDGGPSTQLYASAGGRVIDVPGGSDVADALVVLPGASP